MKKVIVLLLLTSISCTVFSQQKHDEKYLDKVKTLDTTIATLYQVISGEAGEKRNWELFHYLFVKEARLIPSAENNEGEVTYRFLSPQEYIDSSGAWLEKNGFFEKEMYRKTETFGNIAHIFSTYESFRSQKDTQPFMRGINSIQLLNDGKRWWILNVYWTPETPKNPIPKAYTTH